MSVATSSALHVKPQFIRVPVFSQIAAGSPFHETLRIGWRWIRVPRNYRPGYRLCAVQISGDSLMNKAILTGDYAICRLTSELDFNGQLAAVLITEGLTLKFCHYQSDGGLWLRAANPNYRDRYYSPGEAIVQGVVMMIERDM